jgi:hypothetical protein
MEGALGASAQVQLGEERGEVGRGEVGLGLEVGAGLAGAMVGAGAGPLPVWRSARWQLPLGITVMGAPTMVIMDFTGPVSNNSGRGTDGSG